VALGAPYLPSIFGDLSTTDSIIDLLEVSFGLFLLLRSTTLTVTADRTSSMLTLAYRSLVMRSKKEIPFSQVARIELELSGTRGRQPSYRIVVVCKDGQILPFHAYYSSGTADKAKKVQQLQTFLGLAGDGMSPASPAALVQQIYQQQQEALTGSESQEHVTNGVHWQVQTTAFGSTPVTRWFSPDFKMDGGFLYLAQKVHGQSSGGGGLLGGLAKLLYQNSLKIFGFGEQDTPGLAQAELLTQLNPALEAGFLAFTSSPAAARRILNPYVTIPLAAWAARYPLKQLQAPGPFGQLAVLFSPLGLYLATMGAVLPEALDELTNLGVELVKSQ
jgi:hypothetical protein